MLAPRWTHHPCVGWLPELGTLAQRTLLLLWTFGRVDAPVCLVWPSARTLADALKSHPSRVREAVRELEVAGALARVSGDFSHIHTRKKFHVRRRVLALIAHPGARVATSHAYRQGPPLNKKALRQRPPTEQKSIALASPTEQKSIALASPEQLTINNNLKLNPSSSSIADSRGAAPSAQKHEDDDDEIGEVLAVVDSVNGAIPWGSTIQAVQRDRLSALAAEHGAAGVGRALVAVRRDLVRRRKVGLTGPAMLEPSAWAHVWAHHAPVMLRAMRPEPKPTEPTPRRDGPAATPADVSALLDSLMTEPETMTK